MKRMQEAGEEETAAGMTTLLPCLLPNKQARLMYYWALCFLQVQRQVQLAHQGKEWQ